VPVLGGVENMAEMQCPHCGERIDVFAPASAERAIWADGVPLLGRVPLDPDLDQREPEFDAVANELVTRLEAA
jgi:Mrp family chromosome partitioning ATPase